MDGIPISTADGLFDLFEIDPTAYRYVEVYKGANALRYGSNSLGGAINFVMPTGTGRISVRGAVRCRQLRIPPDADGAPVEFRGRRTISSPPRRSARTDIASTAEPNSQRLNANFGYQFSQDAETRFYLNAGQMARRDPRRGDQVRGADQSRPPANPDFVLQNQQRNIDSGAPRQQDDAAVRRHHGRLRNSSASIAMSITRSSRSRLHGARLRRICPRDRRPSHRRIPDSPGHGRQTSRTERSTSNSTSICPAP